MLLLAASVIGLYAAPARADVWGYVDERGMAHFSAERLDERYALFFRGNEGSESFAAGKKPVGGLGSTVKNVDDAVALHAASGYAPAKLLAFFDVSPNYKASSTCCTTLLWPMVLTTSCCRP